jgi:hypothetical protein
MIMFVVCVLLDTITTISLFKNRVEDTENDYPQLVMWFEFNRVRILDYYLKFIGSNNNIHSPHNQTSLIGLLRIKYYLKICIYKQTIDTVTHVIYSIGMLYSLLSYIHLEPSRTFYYK